MKVLCINTGPIWNPYLKQSFSTPELTEGEPYIVEKVTYSGDYQLVGVKCNFVCGFRHERFIPISDIDETEMERNYVKEKV